MKVQHFIVNNVAKNNERSEKKESESNEDLYIIAYIKGKEKYIFNYDERTKKQLFRTFGKYAGNPTLSFTWQDASRLSKMVHNVE